jgi:protease-4
MKKEVKSKWGNTIVIILILAVLSFIAAGFISLIFGDENSDGNVAVIPIKGLITGDSGGLFGQEVASSPDIVNFIEKADSDPRIKGIIFEINSPGGSPVATEEISNAIEKTEKPTVGWIRESGTSGAYWIASSCDTIVASRMSFTGSIGVLASYVQVSGFIQDHNITYERLVGGEYKDIGSPFKDLSFSERALLQEQIDRLHTIFIQAVAKNRNLSEDSVRELATGMFFLGEEAKEKGLVDVLGGKDEAIEILHRELNVTVQPVEYKEERSLISILSGIFSEQAFYVGKGIGSSIFDAENYQTLQIRT